METNITEIIYPKNIKKYGGTLMCTKKKHYRCTFGSGKNRISKTFKIKKNAIEYKKKKSNELKLTKNIIYKENENYEMLLSNGEKMKFDKDDMETIDKYIWIHIRDNLIKNKENEYYHRKIMNVDKNNMVIHINGNKLDNRKVNLKIISKSLSSILNSSGISNKTGHIGIYRENKKNRWIGYYYDNGKIIKKTYSINKYGDEYAMKLAINFRNGGTKRLKTYQTAKYINKKRKILSDEIDKELEFII